MSMMNMMALMLLRGYSEDLATAGALISSTAGGGSTAAAAFDNDTAVGFASNEVSPNVSGVVYMGQNFSALKHIRRIRLWQGRNAGFSTNSCITSVKVQWSDNGSAWTDEGTHEITATDAFQTLELSATGYHQYWRILANGNSVDSFRWVITEVEMMDLG